MKTLTLILALPLVVAAQLHPGARVFIDDPDGYLIAEIQKQELPITVTTKEDTADFILVTQQDREKRGWRRGVLGGEPDTGTASLRNRKTGDIVWSESVGGRSLLKGDFKSKKRIAKKLAEALGDAITPIGVE